MSKWYGNINNRIEEASNYKEPKVDMPLTEYMYSDRRVYHVSAIKTPKLIEAIEDKVVFNQQGYAVSITVGTEQPIQLRWSESRHGWCLCGDPKGSIFRLGIQDPYNDPSF